MVAVPRIPPRASATESSVSASGIALIILEKRRSIGGVIGPAQVPGSLPTAATEPARLHPAPARQRMFLRGVLFTRQCSHPVRGGRKILDANLNDLISFLY